MSLKVWSVTSGKGGVGKTFFSTNLAMSCVRNGKKVLIVDLDIGGGNVHTALGQPLKREKSIQLSLLKQKSFRDLIQVTDWENLHLVTGFTDLSNEKCFIDQCADSFLAGLKELSYDIVILDLGSTLNSFLKSLLEFSNEKILITTPEPAAIERNYRLIESLKEHLTTSSKAGPKSGVFKLVLNQSRSHFDSELLFSVQSVCRKFYKLNVDTLGYIDFDNAVWKSYRHKMNLQKEMPYSIVNGQILSMVKVLFDEKVLASDFKLAI
jgi:flagellar biosynthesis protein FlhG